MINYLVRFHLGADSGFQGTWRLYGAVIEVYNLATNIGSLSLSKTELLAATVVIVQMINAVIATAFHDDLTPKEHHEAFRKAAELFGSAFKTIDIKASDTNILSSVHHLGKI